MKHVTCQEVAPLLPASAAGALDQEDEQRVSQHLALCPPCLKHLHEFQEAVEQLAYAVPQVAPPVYLRGRVLRAVATTPQEAIREARPGPGAGRAVQAAARPGRLPNRLVSRYTRVAPAALAACVVLLLASSVWMGVMAQQLAFMKPSVEHEQAFRALLGHPDAQVIELTPSAAAGQARGEFVLAPGQRQVAIITTHLPQAAAGRGYRVWMVDRNSGHPPVDIGWLQPDSAGVVMAVVDTPGDPYNMACLRITTDPLDGPVGPTLLEAWYR